MLHCQLKSRFPKMPVHSSDINKVNNYACYPWQMLLRGKNVEQHLSTTTISILQIIIFNTPYSKREREREVPCLMSRRIYLLSGVPRLSNESIKKPVQLYAEHKTRVSRNDLLPSLSSFSLAQLLIFV